MMTPPGGRPARLASGIHWIWPVGAGIVLGAAAVWGPVPAALLLLACLGLLVLLRGWPTSGAVLLVVASLLTRFRTEVGPVSVRPEHVAALLVGALLLWQLVFHRRPFRLDWPGFFALGWLAANLVAAVLNAPNLTDSLRHMFRLSLMVLTYLVGANVLRKEEQWWTALRWFLALVLLESSFGIFARLLYPFGINLGVQVAWVLTEPVPYGTMEEGNMFGSHAASWLVLCLFLLVAELAPRRVQRPGSLMMQPWVLACVAGATGIAWIISFSRGAWLAGAVGLGLLLIFYSRRSRGQYLRATLLVVGGPLLVAAAIFLLQSLPGSTPLAARMHTFTNLVTDATFTSRLGNYFVGVQDWLRHPWIGWGPGTFFQLHGLRNYAPAWLSNQLVRTVQETGIIGLLFYAGFAISLIWNAVRSILRTRDLRARAALLGLTAGFIVLQVAYQATDGTWLAAVWVHAALLASGSRLLVGVRGPSPVSAPVTGSHSPVPARILFVHSSDEMYGSDVVLLELVRRLDRARFAPMVALPADIPYHLGGARLSDELERLGVPYRHIDFLVLRRRYLTPRQLPGAVSRLWRGSTELKRWIEAEDVAVIHANTSAVIGGAVAARMAARPLVWHVHEIIERPRWLAVLLARLVVRFSDQVVAISSSVADQLIRLGGARRGASIRVIPDAVDSARFNPTVEGSAVRAAWGISDDQVLVGSIGRLHSWKGQEVLVEAAHLLQAELPHLRFVIVGDIVPGQPEARDRLESAIARWGLEDTVRLEGFRRDIPEVLAALDLLVLPSTSPEPFGLVVVEAMATAKPVIATAHGGPMETVADGITGMLTPPGDAVALAGAIARLAADPELRRAMGEAGRKRVEEFYQFPAHVAQFEALYGELLARRWAGSPSKYGVVRN